MGRHSEALMARPDTAVDAMLNAIGRYAVLPHEQQLEACRAVQRWLQWEGGADAAPQRNNRPVGARCNPQSNKYSNKCAI